MATTLSPYLHFRDNTREAMEFYHSIFGGEVKFSTFKDNHAAQDPSEESLIMHSVLKTPDGMMFMASDTPPRMEYKPGTNFSMSLSGGDESELRGFFDKLCEGGQMTMPLERSPWGAIFGMCVDRFGVHWLVNILVPAGAAS